jgi:serine/threonine protein kinase
MKHVGINPSKRGRDAAYAPGEQARSASNDLSMSDSSSGPSSVQGAEGRRVTDALAAGQLLSGPYRVVRLRGKGGFGAVYKAHDEHFEAQRVVTMTIIYHLLFPESRYGRSSV